MCQETRERVKWSLSFFSFAHFDPHYAIFCVFPLFTRQQKQRTGTSDFFLRVLIRAGMKGQSVSITGDTQGDVK